MKRFFNYIFIEFKRRNKEKLHELHRLLCLHYEQREIITGAVRSEYNDFIADKHDWSLVNAASVGKFRIACLTY